MEESPTPQEQPKRKACFINEGVISFPLLPIFNLGVDEMVVDWADRRPYWVTEKWKFTPNTSNVTKRDFCTFDRGVLTSGKPMYEYDCAFKVGEWVFCVKRMSKNAADEHYAETGVQWLTEWMLVAFKEKIMYTFNILLRHPNYDSVQLVVVHMLWPFLNPDVEQGLDADMVFYSKWLTQARELGDGRERCLEVPHISIPQDKILPENACVFVCA